MFDDLTWLIESSDGGITILNNNVLFRNSRSRSRIISPSLPAANGSQFVSRLINLPDPDVEAAHRKGRPSNLINYTVQRTAYAI